MMVTSHYYKTVVVVLLCSLMVGCGLPGGSHTISDLEAEYNRAQDAIAHAEQLNASKHSPELMNLAKDRLETVRENQLSAPSVDVIREYKYVQSVANQAALNSLHQQVETVRQQGGQPVGAVQVDTGAIQQRIASLENQLEQYSRSLDELTGRSNRQSARLENLEDTAGQVSSLKNQLRQIRRNLASDTPEVASRVPPTRMGDTLNRVLSRLRNHDQKLTNLCESVRLLKKDLETHLKRIDRESRARYSGLVYPEEERGLVAYWPFEEENEARFEDVTGNLSTRRTGGTVETASGIFGSSGVSFSGEGSLVEISDHGSLDPGRNGFAVSVWLKTSSSDGEAGLISKWNDGTGTGWYLRMDSNRLVTTMRSDGNTLEVSSDNALTDGKWHHVALIYNEGVGGDAGLRLFVDGSLKGQARGRISLDTEEPLYLGGSPGSPVGSFEGKLDEIRIYNRSLNRRKVSNLAARPHVPVSEVCDYTGPGSDLNASQTIGFVPKKPEPDTVPVPTKPKPEPAPEPVQKNRLIAHWPLDNTGDTWTPDRVGEARGRLFGVRTGVPGQISNAMEFRGDTDRVRIPDRPVFDDLSSVTVTAWVYPEQIDRQYLVTKGIPQEQKLTSPYGLYLTQTGDIVFSLNTTEGFNQLRKVGYNLNEWIFVVGTYDGSRMSLYVNGEKVSDLAVTGGLQSNNLPIFLGSRYGTFGGIHGRLDDVRIYNYGLDDGEIQRLYRP